MSKHSLCKSIIMKDGHSRISHATWPYWFCTGRPFHLIVHRDDDWYNCILQDCGTMCSMRVICMWRKIILHHFLYVEHIFVCNWIRVHLSVLILNKKHWLLTKLRALFKVLNICLNFPISFTAQQRAVTRVINFLSK